VREHPEMSEVLTNSRWYVELQMGQGKASYEMGKHKESLRWHLLAWQAFLKLLAGETHTEASTEKIDEALEWLEGIRFEQEVRKGEVLEHLAPVVEQLKRVRVSERLGTLAAEILLRLGHVLFVLNLQPEPALDGNPQKLPAGMRIVENLSFDCLKTAAECDPYSPLAGADLLKSSFRALSRLRLEKDSVSPEVLAGFKDSLELPEMERVEEQWPRGGEDYENITRVAEYLMLLALEVDDAPRPEDDLTPQQIDQGLAQRLLLDFFMHTDSINVRKEQTHHYLMRERQGSGLPTDSGQPAIELICMRRYSSATPLLPRPSAFRAHGGGYFVRLHSKRDEPDPREPDAAGEEQAATPPSPPPFGVVVDPGPDFIENLYRTGFSLSDIDMIVVTHDHVDHLNSLEPLLSLMHYRSDLLRHQSSGKTAEQAGGNETSDREDEPIGAEQPPIVYGNASVCQRYGKVKVLNPEQKRFRDLGDLHDGATQPEDFPPGFQIVSMSSAAMDELGHLDLSGEPSYGICFRHLGDSTERADQPDKISLAITSDTPAPPSTQDPEHEGWQRTWLPALRADALVAHMSTVPLSELRQLARLDARVVIRSADVKKLGERIHALATKTQTADSELKSIVSDLKELIEKDPPHPAEEDLRRERKAVKKLRKETDSLQDLLKDLEMSLGELHAASDPKSMQSAILAAEEAATEVSQQALELVDPLKGIAHRQVIRDCLLGLVDDAQKLALEAQRLPRDAVRLEEIRSQLEEVGDLRGRIEFAMWLRSRSPGPTADMVGLVPSNPEDPTKHWLPPREHPYLDGTLRWARAYQQERENSALGSAVGLGLFVLGELSEELGTVRGKVAGRINETLFGHRPGSDREEGIYALTSDVGLHLVVVAGRLDAKRDEDQGEKSQTVDTSAQLHQPPVATVAEDKSDTVGETGTGACVKILCTTCDLDTDRTPKERYHSPNNVYEVCVKGENEGVFYNCTHHNPGKQPKPLFLEQLERFDVFGR
jgi:hypothetical protein